MIRLAAVALVLAGLGLLGGAPPALGHAGGSTGYAEVTVQGRTVRYALSLPADVLPGGVAADLEQLTATVAAKVSIAADGVPCAAVPAPATPPAAGRATVQVVVLYACAAPAGELAITDAMSEALGEAHHTLAEIRSDGGRAQRSFEAGGRDARVAIAEAAGAAPGAATNGFPEFLGLGMQHILLAADRLLLVLALVLPLTGLRSLAVVIAAFALAHGVGLAVAMLGWLAVPAAAEALAALSAVCVAAETLLRGGRAAPRRWPVALLAGMVLGATADPPALGLRPSALPLLGFIAGVLAAAALVVAALLPLLLWVRRLPWHGRLLQAASACILLAGLLLLTGWVMAVAG